MNVDSRVDRADLILSGLVCATAEVEASVVLVLKSSSGRNERRSSDNGGLHLEVGMATGPVLIRCISAERVKRYSSINE